MKKILLSFAILLTGIISFSQSKEIIHLWPGAVPGETAEKNQPVPAPQKDNVFRFTTVTDPAIEVWAPEPEKKNGAAVIVCPGGGYNILAYDLEGTEVAGWLNKLGYYAFVLQYRVPKKREGALQDAQRAIRIVRNNAKKWDIDAGKLGIMGFSAGGSLSARAATNFKTRTYSPVDTRDSLSCRPDFAMLIYPAYLDMGEGRTLTPELKLPPDTPPVFIFQTADDSYGNSALVMATALRDAKLPVEMHLMPAGGHGYGLRPGKTAAETWPRLAEKWLNQSLY